MKETSSGYTTLTRARGIQPDRDELSNACLQAAYPPARGLHMGIRSSCRQVLIKRRQRSPLLLVLHLDLPLSPLHVSEVFPLFCLDRASDEVNCWEREVSVALAPRPETPGRMSIMSHLPTACRLLVARASTMLLNKQHRCGHTLFYELSHGTGWLLVCCCLILQAAENKEQRCEGQLIRLCGGPVSFASGDGDLTLGSLLMLKYCSLT